MNQRNKSSESQVKFRQASKHCKICKKWSSGLIIKVLDFKSRGPIFKTNGLLQGQLRISSFQCQSIEYNELPGTGTVKSKLYPCSGSSVALRQLNPIQEMGSKFFLKFKGFLKHPNLHMLLKQESITSLELSSHDFCQFANSVFNNSKSAIPIFNFPEMFSSVSEED